MGCTSSAPKVDEGALPDENVPAAEKVADGKAKTAAEIKEEKAAAQRRRLSVAPKHVGDVSGDHKVEEAKAGAAAEQKSAVDGRKDRGAGVSLAVHVSKKGYVPYNRSKVNQDRHVMSFHLSGSVVHLMGVMDGHGENGHHVAQLVQDALPVHVGKQKTLTTDIPAALLAGTKETCDQLANSGINIAFSGTTACYGIYHSKERRLYVANIGDSRCVLAQDREDGSVRALALSKDQKPDDPEEHARILKAGGRVETLPGPPDEDCGPPRVWLAEVDVPGLAMSRSIGDEVSQTVGVISIPEIKHHDIVKGDRFCVFASDGVWEFISDQEAVDIIHKHGGDSKESASAAGAALVAEAHKRWTMEEEVVDDITAVIVWFDHSDAE